MSFVWGALALTPLAIATRRAWPAWSHFLLLALGLAGLIALWWGLFLPPVTTVTLSDGTWTIYSTDRRIALLLPLASLLLGGLWAVLRRHRAPAVMVWLAALTAATYLCLTHFNAGIEVPRRYADYPAYQTTMTLLFRVRGFFLVGFAAAFLALAAMPLLTRHP